MIVCSSSNPGMDGKVYVLPYIESVDGKRHGYMSKHNGVEWTRNPYHPEDPRCPECAEQKNQ